ncbi:hypothetical protein C2869_19410 [Saccharobesus litoralis]|uniref:Uncharacterized protein n=1 Tax=Saccharobesus litoralis TaxID=2172099 RepID=A0A2S0VW53_9ALTE|nr:hypothetical protein [Saccharobesus litoralis]AWB68441.1 hypothetical protein C2869_19410 [Saccharobesus litoralis]
MSKVIQIIQVVNAGIVTSNNAIKERSGVFNSFDFPNEIKAIFNQYLFYFGKFLEDLGIENNTSIESKDSQTILTVEPKDEADALHKINSALATYLSLPSSDLASIVIVEDSLEAQVRYQQLAATVQHLQSQLSLSKTELSLKNREIELLENNLDETKKQLPSTDIIDYWEPIEGLQFKKYEGKWFNLDVPKIVNKIKAKIEDKNNL